jgi:methyl-accepting chemotaxis protein
VKRASTLRGAHTPQAPAQPDPLRSRDALSSMMNSNTPARRRTRNLLLDVPIAWRLTLGFLLAALIAAFAASIPAVQRATALSRESAFYESLLSTNTSLTTADSFLQLMDTKVHQTLLDAAAAVPSRETLATDQTDVQGLVQRYDTTLSDYARFDLLALHSDEVAVLDEAGHSIQVTQQKTFTSSVLRTWQVYRAAQSSVMQNIAAGNLADAQAQERAQGEPTNADALSALRALILFNGRIAGSIHDAAIVEQQNQVIIALIAAAAAFLAVGFVGWIISNTLVRRLRLLRRVTQEVERGEVDTRVTVIGRDEIGGVSASINGMLDTIVGLLDVTRRQRDALTNAAERLFADVRLAGAGDLRISAAVTDDPVGLLANAFNFTVGRFRRFVLRAQSTVDQLDVVGRQEIERIEVFMATLQQHVREVNSGVPKSSVASLASTLGTGAHQSDSIHEGSSGGELGVQVEGAREMVRQLARAGANYHARAVLDLAERAYSSAERLSQITVTIAKQQQSYGMDELVRAQMDEVRTLGAVLTQMGTEAYGIQQNTGTKLSELDAVLARLSLAPHAPSYPASGTPSSTPSMAGAALYDIVRLSNGFAQDIATLTRQKLVVTSELRSGLAPYRLEGSGVAAMASPADYQGAMSGGSASNPWS